MKLIVGLGNPGREYEKTRHNSGFMAADLLADRLGVNISTEKWNALTASVRIEGTPVLLMKPLTYMNLSGSAVSQAVSYFKILPEDILIMHDDMDLPTGSVRGDHEVVPDWVLSPVPKSEQDIFERSLRNSAEAAYAWVNEPMDIVMQKYNIKIVPESEQKD